MKDHAGGSTPENFFRIPVEWAEEQRVAIRIEQFDFEALDTLEDTVREALKTNRLKHLLRGMFQVEAERIRTEAVAAAFAEVVDARDPGLAAVQISFAAGIMTTAKKTGPYYAAKFGISKEAFQQGVRDFERRLLLRKSRTQRDDQARAKMRLANHRPKERLK